MSRAAAASGASARGSSFYMAMRLLPPAEREAMFAIYGFCREVDDIADDPGPSREERRAALSSWRVGVDELYAGAPRPEWMSLASAVRRFDLAKEDFVAIIDGMKMDVDGPIRAPPFAVFDLYCDRVASAVGRLGVRVFGLADQPGRRLAEHLGRALQFTNILRDLDEDAAVGRLYLPAEALAEAGLTSIGREPADILASPAVDSACRWLAARARAHYRLADEVLAGRPPGRLVTPRLMIAVYRRLLGRMEASGWAPPRVRARLGKAQLLGLVLRHGLGR